MKRNIDLISQINNTSLSDDCIAIWQLGQESMVVKSGETICYFDPYLSNNVDDTFGNSPRSFKEPVDPSEINNADFVFISHDHLDHLDPETLVPIAKNSQKAKFICPAPHVHILIEIGIEKERIIAARAKEKINIGGMEIYPVAEKHEDYSIDSNGNHGYLGYVVRYNEVVFYHAGDTIGFYELAEDLKPLKIDVACLPINGRDFKRLKVDNLLGNMDFREAAELSNIIGADTIIPMHYDLFGFNTENPAYFVDYLLNNYPDQKFKLLTLGERMIYMK
ncbi:MBL fold metallo-hydrolase [Clostridium sp. 19966]|uniref:MBL fold metallo-hydrolase n=1 Tax=Clostridium sp. 19966 TaxID=2768166 RepID=UPI0028DDAED3|nr:MBL fold metallo-hydrolase [Clostridium sp. 19966]MDT8717202.1 MBL fold metallo-hydrolase [Clostridium sp. 19966]